MPYEFPFGQYMDIPYSNHLPARIIALGYPFHGRSFRHSYNGTGHKLRRPSQARETAKKGRERRLGGPHAGKEAVDLGAQLR